MCETRERRNQEASEGIRTTGNEDADVKYPHDPFQHCKRTCEPRNRPDITVTNSEERDETEIDKVRLPPAGAGQERIAHRKSSLLKVKNDVVKTCPDETYHKDIR